MRSSWPFLLALAVTWTPGGVAGQEPVTAVGAPEGTGAVAVIGGTLVDGTGGAPVPGSVIVIRDGRIECVGPVAGCAVPGDAAVVDARGKWVIPGLIDAHVHYSQTGFADGRPDALDLRERFPYDSTVAANRLDPWRYHRAYLCSGVTAVFDVGGFPWTWSMREDAAWTDEAPHVAAAGPLLSTADHWLNLPGERQFIHIATDSAVEAGARYVALNGSDALKVWFLHGESSADAAGWEHRVMLAGRLADEWGLPFLVHATGLWQAKVAVRAGADVLVHSVYEEAVDQEFLDLARAAGTIYTPTLIVHEGYAQLAARDFDEGAYGDELACVDPETRAKAFLTDSLPGGPAADRQRMRAAGERRSVIMAENLLRVRAAGIPVAMGTDAGNPLTLAGPSVYLEMEAMQAAGMTPMEVLVASTRTAAAAMGRGDAIGTVERGKVGDLVVLDADPLADIRNVRQVDLVVRGGRVLRRANLRQP
ncbi:MAG TPA: amidohydrolase family protein [Longimicrobiales bacterium]|nr:amidohydrolase family protein [Longimicrobiales bacterium]